MIKEYGYEYETVLAKELFEKTKGKATHKNFLGAMCLRSGRDALKVIAREFSPTFILMPALACDSMILPFKMYDHEIRYYKLNEDYSIDLDSLYSLITNEEKTFLFLYMDYFGNKAIHDVELKKLRSCYPGLVFIEDRTHNFLVQTMFSFKPDYLVASLRKWIDIPDGGLLWTDRELQYNSFVEDMTFSETRLQAQCMRHEFLQCGDKEIKIKYRQIFSTVTDMIDAEILPGLMSQYAYERASKIDLREVIAVRKRNAQVLIDELKGYKFIQPESGHSDVYVAVLIENRDAVQRKLASMGIFCTVIWPLNDEQKLSCKVARYTEEHMLTIYCDQRYSVNDMKYIASCIRGISNE